MKNLDNTDDSEIRSITPPSGGMGASSLFRGLGGSCIIVEDEELPRLSLKTKLETYHPDIQILDMCDNCDDALESILRHKPELLFLDIQLPEKNSIWLIEQLEKIMKLPLIIFTTAYTDAEYLIKAIKISAVDYLQKPVNLMELSQALEKTRKLIREQKTADNPELANKIYSFKTYNSVLLADCDEIVYCQADGNYTKIILLHGKSELIFERIGEIESRICRQKFIRAGRSLIINRKYIHKINSKENSCQLVTQTNTYNLSIPKFTVDKLKEEFTK